MSVEDAYEILDEELSDEAAAAVRALDQQKSERIELLEEENEYIRDESVFTVAVERVLLEYGLSTERVDEIVAAIEDVDAQLKAGDDDV